MLTLPPEQATELRRQLATRACTLAQALGIGDDAPAVQFEYVAQALVQGFAITLNLTFKPGQATPAELREAARLIRVQYANPEWTQGH